MPRNVAIAIGVNHYQYENSLQFAGNDAKAMRSYLQGIGFEEVLLYTDDEEGYHPELTNLIIGLDRISKTVRLEKDDSLWFFFSGHGGRQGGRDFLLPTNGYSQNLERTAIAIEDVVRALAQCGAGNLVMILDACRNVIPEHGKGSQQTIELVKQAGIITLFSCKPGQKSYELPDVQQGAFTYGLLRALEGEYHPNRCNVLQLSEYLRQIVPALVAEKLNAQQSPYVIAEPVEKAMQMLLPLPQKVEPVPVPDIPEDTNQSASGKSAGSHVGALMREAFRATQRQDWEEAKQLWERVLFEAHDPEDRKLALEQRDYASSQQSVSVEEEQKKLELERERQGQAAEAERQRLEKLRSEERQQLEVIRMRERREQEEAKIKAEASLPKSFVEDLGNGVKLEMILIPKGSFMMGSVDGDNDEKPQHRVEITQEFYIGKYQITQGQWQAVTGNNPSWFQKGGDYPVERVSWDDCHEFLEKLNQKARKRYRLPSEAEWEYACRAGTTTRYYFGDDEKQLGEYVWFEGNSGSRTHPVGQKKPNQFGLYDMHGNVWEWCEDSWEDNYKVSRSQKPFVNSSSLRVIRGGSWYALPRLCRSANRYNLSRALRYYDVGFRVVCSLPG
jgi:formylglycine-generating enzyme required for sulfatase activity/uncharacterized caspase-like protein